MTTPVETRRRQAATKLPPFFLVGLGGITAIGILLPPLYLIVRASRLGWEGFWSFVLRPQTFEVLLNSALMSATVTLVCALIAIPLAFLTVMTDLPGRRFWTVATALPLAIPTYVGSFTLIATLGPRGSMLQNLLAPWGVERLPSLYGLPGTVAAIALFSYPYMLLTVRSGLQGLNASVDEMARSLGYGPWGVFFRVTLPQMRPSIVVGSLLVALYALQDFGTPTMMRFNAFTQAIFLQYRASFDRSLAAALSLVLVALVIGILWIEYLARSRAAYFSRGSQRPVQRIPLGRWKWPALLFCSLIVLVCLGMPLSVILYWLLRVPNTGAVIQRIWPFALNSVGAAGLAAIAATLFALPVAILSVRFPSRISALIERGTYVGYGLPGVVVALSLVFFGANLVPRLYQTMPMLIFAYLILFLPQSVGTIRNALLQVNPSLEESAQSLGYTPWQILRKITIPLVRSGMTGGAVLVFLTAIKELPATLLLSPIGFRTLASEIWVATGNAAFANAAAASGAMLIICTLLTLVVLSQEKGQQVS